MQYSAILRNYTIVADYSEYQENFQEILIKFYIANRQNLEFYVIPYYSQYEIFFLHWKEYIFSCISLPNEDSENILLFLQHVKTEFQGLLSKEKDQLTLKSTTLLRSSMHDFSSNKGKSKIGDIERELEAIRNEKQEMINTMIDKEMQIDNVVKKGEDLKRSSLDMRHRTKKRLDKSIGSRQNLIIFLIVILIVLSVGLYLRYVYSDKKLSI